MIKRFVRLFLSVIAVVGALFTLPAAATPLLERECGALASDEYFLADSPSLRSQVVTGKNAYPLWRSDPIIFVSEQLNQAVEKDISKKIFGLAGLSPKFTSSREAANLSVLAFYSRTKKRSPGVICMTCSEPVHSPRSDFEILHWYSPLGQKSYTLSQSAPLGQETDEKYWPYDNRIFLASARRDREVGNVFGALAVGRDLSIVGAECWVSLDLNNNVQKSLVAECFARALGFPSVGQSSLLRSYGLQDRLTRAAVKIDASFSRCVAALYKGATGG